jgi:hypothetical protein
MRTEKAWILVKAYPQPSKKYQETVCCAAITEDGLFLRLYPIRYRHLKKEQQFERFDLLEFKLWKAEQDPRPESFKVDESSIVILKNGKDAKSQSKISLWNPFVCESIEMLKDQQLQCGKSLGIIKPDDDSLKFIVKPIKDASAETKEIMQSAYDQISLFEDNIKPLEKPEYVFSYRFKSANKQHEMQIHDWEVQATYRNYKIRYGSSGAAISMMEDFYDKKIIEQSPHFIMGNMRRSPSQFMIIGILRSSPANQASLFEIL